MARIVVQDTMIIETKLEVPDELVEKVRIEECGGVGSSQEATNDLFVLIDEARNPDDKGEWCSTHIAADDKTLLETS